MSKKNIFVVCKYCGKSIRLSIERDLDISQEEGLYRIVHAHGDLGEDPHAIIVEIDKNLNVRNLKVADKLIFTFDI
ncbi:MAG: hypothetical protein ACTSRZ_21175 [Promethearchaeota archaeon]